MPPVEPKIDDLYKRSLDEFTAARNALAKTLDGDEARRVNRLQKPTVVAWAVNQVYWHARSTYDRVADTGEKLRAAQVAALKGRAADVRRATEAHRKAIAQAVAEAARRASAAGAHPNPEELTRTFEAVSLARELSEPIGRLTKALQPAGFEALAGVAVKPMASARLQARAPQQLPGSGRLQPSERVPRESRMAAVEKKRAAAESRRTRERERAGQRVAQAKAAEEKARGAWERAKRQLAAAELKWAALQE